MLRVLVIVLFAPLMISCGGNDAAAPTTTTSAAKAPTTTTSPGALGVTFDSACPGLGEVPKGGEVTWVSEGRLLAGTPGSQPRCLARVPADVSTLEWGGNGDRVLVGRTAVTSSGQVDLPAGKASLTRPTGTSVIVANERTVIKRSLEGKPDLEIGFLERNDFVTYHPAGRHIVAAGQDAELGAGLFLADNLGRNRQLIASAEEDHTRFGTLAFANSGGLHFIADHDGSTHIHRLNIETGALTTVDEVEGGDLVSLVVSPFSGGGVAWMVAEGGCSPNARMRTRAVRGGKEVALGVALKDSTPVGFTPDGTFVAFSDSDGCERGTDLYALKQGEQPVLLASDVEVAALRGVHGPPMAPPAKVPSSAPA